MNKFTLYTLQTLLLSIFLTIDATAQLSLERFANLSIENVKAINSNRLDFSPTYYQNGLVFISSRSENGSRDEKINETFFKMYYAPFDAYKHPFDVQQFSVELDSPLHEGPVCFNRQGDIMYFTRNSQEKGFSKADAHGVVKLQIYKAEKTEFGWTKITKLPFSSTEYSVVHPTLSVDGQYLFFASDMPGGFGGMDLYYVKLQKDGSWSQPINLGNKVNSSGQDVFPFIHASGQLFFASNRAGGFGGMDLYMTDNNQGDWTAAVNLGNAINSDKDDLGLIIDAAGKEGYFTSSRDGGVGEDDIYHIKFQGNTFAQAEKVMTNIKVSDFTSHEMMAGVHLRVFEKVNSRIYKGNQYYDAVLVPANNGSNELSVKVLSNKNRNVIIPDLVSDLNGVFRFEHELNKEYVLEFYKDGYKTEEVTFLQSDHVANSNLIVQMVSAEEYAYVRNVLKNNQTGMPIANAKVVVEGCGEVQELTTDNFGVYTFRMSQEGCDYSIDFYKQGFYSSKAVVHNVQEAKNLDIGIAAVTIPQQQVSHSTTTLHSGTVVVLDNIYYDYGKSSVRVGNSPELDVIANMLLKYPDMHVELISHTDSRGSSAYNQLLSLKRSESVKKYLVGRGISENRMIAIGYGEEVPRNHCVDGVECTEEEYKYNRRTEVKVTKMREPVAIQYNSDLFYNK